MSSLTKDRLIYDPADVAESDNLGIYVKAGTDGDAISSTLVSGKEGLDVYLVNSSLPISATDLDIRDLTHVSDSVKIGDGTDFLAINNDGSINVSIAGSVTVTATDLDIRDLTHVSDSVKIGDGTDFLAVNNDGSINAVVSGSVTVSATDLDIRDLTHVSDSVKIGDGTDFLAVNADGSINVNLTDDGVADDAADSGNPFKVGSRAYFGAALAAISASNDRADLLSDKYRRVFIHDAPQIAAAAAAVSVTTSATALPALDGRLRAIIQNLGSGDVYVGPSGVTTSSGLRVAKGATLTLEVGDAVALYAISQSGTNDVRVMELA